MPTVSLGDFNSKIENGLRLIVPTNYPKKFLHKVGFIWEDLHSQVLAIVSTNIINISNI